MNRWIAGYQEAVARKKMAEVLAARWARTDQPAVWRTAARYLLQGERLLPRLESLRQTRANWNAVATRWETRAAGLEKREITTRKGCPVSMVVVIFGRENVVDEAVYFVESAEELEKARKDAEEMLDGSGPVHIEGQAELVQAGQSWPTFSGFTTLRAYIG